MGILDNKTRILDAIFTVEGRRQMAEGTFNVSYVTFSDSDVCYEADSDEGHVDPTDRVYLEAQSLPQDQIIFEANDAGKLVALRDRTLDFEQIDSLFPKQMQVSFFDGNAVVTQTNFGARVKVSSIPKGWKETGVGFTFQSSDGKVSRLLLDKNVQAGTGSYQIVNNRVTSSIGIKGGINSSDLATLIQEQISHAVSQSLLAATVDVFDRGEFLYITDISGSNEKLKISLLTGSINSPTLLLPFMIENSVLGGRTDLVDITSNPAFASQIQNILTSSFDNFQELGTLSTIDPVFEEDKFILSSNNINFDLKRLTSSKLESIKQIPSLNSIDSLFNDDKLSRLENFKYLPPIVKVSDSVVPDKTNLESTKPYLLGNYLPLGQTNSLTFSQLKQQLSEYVGEKVVFQQTTRKNHILCQLFEVNGAEVKKLDLIDFGNVNNDPNDQNVVSNKVFFAGKTFLDNRGTTCYVNMFTLIFSRREDVEE